MYRIENWSKVSDRNGEEHSPPQDYFFCFTGKVYGHPEYPNGTYIRTSRVVGYKDGVFITIGGSEYVLGNVSEKYEESFPNSYSEIVTTAETYFEDEDIK